LLFDLSELNTPFTEPHKSKAWAGPVSANRPQTSNTCNFIFIVISSRKSRAHSHPAVSGHEKPLQRAKEYRHHWQICEQSQHPQSKVERQARLGAINRGEF
jgi:hypothetical protein